MKNNWIRRRLCSLFVFLVLIACVVPVAAMETQHTITFVDEDGTILQTVSVGHGEMPEYTENEPVKEPTVQYAYTFSGWTPEIVPATEEATYTATYRSVEREYTITWLDDEGGLLGTTQAEYGASLTYDADSGLDGVQDPAKENSAQYTYSFAGWAVAVLDESVGTYGPTKDEKNEPILVEEMIVGGDITYIAVFSSEINKYTITWVVEGESEETTFAYGEVPNHVVPGKEFDGSYTYEFTGWYPDVAEVTGDATYTAVFEEALTFLEISLQFGGEDAYYDVDQSYVVDILEGTDRVATVTLQGDDVVCVFGVSVGKTYTVSVQDAWSWRYGSTSKEITISDSGNNAVAIEIKRQITQWLDGSASWTGSSVAVSSPAVNGDFGKEEEENEAQE